MTAQSHLHTYLQEGEMQTRAGFHLGQSRNGVQTPNAQKAKFVILSPQQNEAITTVTPLSIHTKHKLQRPRSAFSTHKQRQVAPSQLGFEEAHLQTCQPTPKRRPATQLTYMTALSKGCPTRSKKRFSRRTSIKNSDLVGDLKPKFKPNSDINILANQLQAVRHIAVEATKHNKCLMNIKNALNQPPLERERKFLKQTDIPDIKERLNFINNLQAKPKKAQKAIIVFQKRNSEVSNPSSNFLQPRIENTLSQRDYDLLKKRVLQQEEAYYKQRDLIQMNQFNVGKILQKGNCKHVTAQQMDSSLQSIPDRHQQQFYNETIYPTSFQSIESNMMIQSPVPFAVSDKQIVVVDMLTSASASSQKDMIASGGTEDNLPLQPSYMPPSECINLERKPQERSSAKTTPVRLLEKSITPSRLFE